MVYFKLLAVLIVVNFFTLPLNASYIVEDPQKQIYNSSRFSALKEEDIFNKSSLVETLWHKVTSTLSSFMPAKHIDLKDEVKSNNLVWWAAPHERDAPKWQHNWSDLVDHVIELNYNQLNNFFDYLNFKLSKPNSQELRNSLQFHKNLIASSFFHMNTIEVNETNYPQFRTTLLEFFNTLRNQPISDLINQDFIDQKDSFFDYDSAEEFEFTEEEQELFLHGTHHNILDQSLLLTECLEEIGSYDRREENLPLLQNAVKRLYRKLDGGSLQDSSISTLRRLGVNASTPHKVDWSRVSKGLPLLLLVGAAGTFNAVAAQRPQFLEDACSGTYKECESAFALLDCCGYASEIATIRENGYFTYAYNTQGTNLLSANREFAIDDTRLGIMRNLNSTSGYYSDLSAYIASSIPEGNITREIYTVKTPYLGQSNIPLTPTQYNQTSYQLYGLGNPANFTSSIVPGSMNSFYLGQTSNSENWIFSVASQFRDFAIGTLVVRPLNGNAPYVVWQRLITNETAATRVVPSNLLTTPVNTNKPSSATERDDNNFEDFLNSLYLGNVDSPGGNNSRTIQKFAADNNLIPNGLVKCLQQISLDPLSCSQFTGNGYTRFMNYFTEQRAGLVTVTKNVVDGPNVNNFVYKQLNSIAVQQFNDSYPWNPSIGTPNSTNSIVLEDISVRQGNLTTGVVEKFAELYLPNSTAAIILRASQSASGNPISYYAILGPGIVSAALNPPTSPTPKPTSSGSSSSSDASVLGGAIGGALGGAALITCAAATGAIIYRHKHNKKKAFDKEDIEMNARSSGMNTVPRDVFGAKEQGLEDARLRVTGAMHGLRYGLYFNIDKAEAQEINAQTGLKIDVPKDEEEIPFHLGAGNFGRVILAKEETGRFRAMKIVAGTKNVKASLREGRLQARLGEKEGVLPLLEYLHFAPTGKNRKEMKQLLVATFGSSVIQGEDMTSQELLLQVTPLAAFGNGETFQKSLLNVSNKKLKDQLLNHFALSLLTGLKNMHDDGVSHLDIKPSNILMHIDGTVYVSDFGCALQKDNLRGGIGDFRYFSPDRIAHSRLLMNRRGHEYEATEMVTHFSGKAADAFATGLTLLEIATNDYPLGREASVMDMINVRDSDYFEERLEDVYEGVSKKLSILPVIKGLLHSKPKKRWTTLKAYEALSELKLKSSPRELFRAFDKELSEEKVESHTREAVNTNVDPSEDSGTSPSYMYENKLPSQHAPQAYGQELPSLYKELQQDYSDGDLSLNSSNDNVDSTDPYTVPDLNAFNSDEPAYMDTGLTFNS
jgi:serine/threonine protein kinase